MEPEADKLHGRDRVEELHRPGGVPAHHRDRAPVRQHPRRPVPRAATPSTRWARAPSAPPRPSTSAGMAMKWRWREAPGGRRQADRPAEPGDERDRARLAGRSSAATSTSSAAQVPLAPGRYVIDRRPGHRPASTRTPSASSASSAPPTPATSTPSRPSTTRSTTLNEQTGCDVPIHVDARQRRLRRPVRLPRPEVGLPPRPRALDQRVGPQVRARLPRHRAGRSGATRADLPEELIFHDNYLGDDQSTFDLNFSKGASQVVGQYYNLIRLGPGRLHAGHGEPARTPPTT